MSRRRVLVAGYYGFGNTGDEAILAAIRAGLAARVPSISCVVISGDPQQTSSQHGVEAISWLDLPGMGDAVRGSDLTIVGGGGLLQDHWGVDPGTLLTQRHYGISFYAGPAVLAALAGKPLALAGLGVGPLSSREARRMVRGVCEASSFLSVRDEGSRNLLLEAGVEPHRITLSTDAAFLLPAERIRPEDVLMATGVEPRAPIVGVALRPWLLGVDQERFEREVAGALDRFVEKTGGTLLLVPFQESARPEEDDASLASRVRQRLQHADRAVVLPSPRPPAEAAGLLAGCDLVVAMRLHAAIFAVAGGVPAVSIAYDPKVSALSARFGLDSLVVPLAEVSAKNLSSRMESALAERDRLKASLSSMAAQQRRLAGADLDALVSLLERPPAPPPVTEALRALFADAVSANLGQAHELSRQNELLQAGRLASEQRLADLQSAATAAEAALARQRNAALLFERQLRETRQELSTLQTSRLWKIANLYWRGRRFAARLSRPARHASKRLAGQPASDWVGPDLAHRAAANAPRLENENRHELVCFEGRRVAAEDGAPALARRMAEAGHRVFSISSRFRSTGPDYEIAEQLPNLFAVSLKVARDSAANDLDASQTESLFTALDALRREQSLGATASLSEDPFWLPLARRLRRERGWPLLTGAADPDDVALAFPRLSVILVTFNNRDLNRLCLESLEARTEWPNLEILVVDNASTDGTRELLSAEARRNPRLRVIFHEENRGFAAACNAGLAAASGDYLVLVNNDTVMTRGALATLVRHLAEDPGLGLVGPVSNAIANEARVEVGYAGLADLPFWARDFVRAHDGETFEIPMLALFCVAMSRPVLEAVGPLDERFGIGLFEDDDYSRRVRAKGFRIRCARDAFVHHWQMASFRKMPREQYAALFEANKRKYEEKWGDAPAGKLHAPSDPARAWLSSLLPRIAASKGAVVFLPSIGWGIHLFQRPHHLARVLARRGYLVVFDCSNADDRVDGFREVEPNLFLFNGEAAILHEIPAPIVWAFPYNVHLARAYTQGARTVYDWIDDLDVFPYDRQLLEDNHARALREATLVVSVARRLNEQALAVRPDALYVPNGVEFEQFSAAAPAPKDQTLSRFLAGGGPVAGYYGALASWFDYELLDEAARLRPDWRFVLIGPKLDTSLEGKPMLSRGNVVWLGPRDYISLPGYLSLFDVATIPFRINAITLSTSPLKLFEYFAAGKPVVTTPMPECEAFPEVAVARDAREFTASLDRMREQGRDPAFRQRLRDLARENSWDRRVDAVLAGLSRHAGSRPIGNGPSTGASPAAPAEFAVGGSRPAGEPAGLKSHAGRCNICGRATEFYYSDPALYRESLNCAYCLTTSRYRSIARGLLEAFRELAGVDAPSLAELPRRGNGRRLSVYDTQTPFSTGAVVKPAHPILRGIARRLRNGGAGAASPGLREHVEKRTAGSAYPIPEILASCPWIDLQISTYRPGDEPGLRLGPRTTNQTLESLTFPDASFDIVVTSDVMEHVRLEDAAHREIRRVLRPGGIYLFTVPHFRSRSTLDRVQIVDPADPSRDIDLLQREYHGDANAPAGRALAYRAFGIDLDEKLRGLGFSVTYTKEDFPGSGILNTELFFCRLPSPSGSGPDDSARAGGGSGSRRG